MPKIGGKRKKARSHKNQPEQQRQLVPVSFVFKKGKCSQTCKQLSKDFRKCFYPHTALKLQNSTKSSIRSYLRAAKHYSVSHLCAFYQSRDFKKTFLRIIQVGGGQMRFRVLNYSRMKDVLKDGGQQFSLAFKQPLLVLNNFNPNSNKNQEGSTNKQVERIGKSLQRMFPALNLEKVNMNSLKRVISFSYNSNKKCIYFRHYKINIQEAGVSKKFKQILSLTSNGGKKMPDLSHIQSFSQFFKINGKGNSNNNNFQQYQQLNQQEDINNNKSHNQNSVQLREIGPRMKLKFVNYYETNGMVQGQQQQQQMQEKQNEQQQENIEQQNGQQNQQEGQEQQEYQQFDQEQFQ